jgi:DNA-binding transcriptional LysR family regulator
MIDLQQLRLFVLAAESKSFTKAAVALNVAQPTVSRVVKELEAAWGEQLFYRTGRGVELSEFGAQALLRSKALLHEAEQASEELRAFGRSPTGVVTLTMPPSMVSPVVPQLVHQLSSECPGIRLRIIEGFSDQIKRWLAEGDVEVGLYSMYHEGEEGSSQGAFTSQLVLAAPSTISLPDEVEFANLAGRLLVLPSGHNGLRAIVDRVARRLHFSLNVLVDADSIHAQKLIAQQCGCCMIKVFHTIASEREKGEFSTSLIVNPTIQRHVTLVTTSQRPLSRAAREVASRIESILKLLHQ